LDFSFDPALESFRQEVRAFVQSRLPADIAARVRHGSYLGHHVDAVKWTSILHERGWSVPHWPQRFGGTGWSPLQLHVFHKECANADAPRLPSAGVYLVGPVLHAVGSTAQQERFLPAIARGEHLWCQGFSEPGAGSDLASLRTSAVQRGDDFVVNGQKLWTSAAHVADWGFFLVRTDATAKPQAGISFLLIDMKSPGVTVRPVITLDGEHHTNEVFLDNVEVPLHNLVGELNRGWNYAKTLLADERTMSAEIYWTKRELQKLKAIVAAERHGDNTPLAQDAVFGAKVAELEIRVLALETSVLRILAAENNRFASAAVTSALKVRGSELMQRVAELQAEALGARSLRVFESSEAAAPDDPAWPAYVPGRIGGELTLRAATIFGGAREIQKNIIAKSAFGF
jgi:alkylation response protein AidB-like acyl-CoA dehydrogenase